MVEKTIFGTMEDGREVSRYTLTNQNGVSASFLDLGAIWSTMLVPDRNGEMADVLLGHETVADCLVSDGHLGEAVGRNANRIGGAAFTLNNKKYELTANDGPNNLHSGMDFYRNRIWAAEMALERSGEEAKGAVMASDAFFPFDDCVEAAAKAGITAIIQPGGSIREEDSIKKCDENGIAMVFTGIRHFRH